MAEVILGLQTAVTRKFSVFDPVVVTVGVANAGGAPNVIPECCQIGASIRTLTPQTRAKAAEVLPTVVRNIAAAHGMTAEVEWVYGVGPTVNDPATTDFVVHQIGSLLGPDRVQVLAEPFMGSEDFSFVLDQVPGTFVFYSAVPRGCPVEEATFNHSATATFDDDVLVEATAVYVQLARAALAELAEVKAQQPQG